MQFYNTSNPENSLVHECWALVDADITSYPLATVTRRMNIALEELAGLIINADGTWQYDDTNHTDHPVGKGTLVEGQQDYSFASEYLQIEAVDYLGLDNVYHRLAPLDMHDFKDQSPDEYFGMTSGSPTTGTPEYFDANGDTIRLYPAPSATFCTLASGLRVWFKRAPDLFATTDTTQQPGLPSSYHSLLSYKAALPYAAIYKQDRVPYLRDTIATMTKELIESYCHREKSRPARMTMSEISFD